MFSNLLLIWLGTMSLALNEIIPDYSCTNSGPCRLSWKKQTNSNATYASLQFCFYLFVSFFLERDQNFYGFTICAHFYYYISLEKEHSVQKIAKQNKTNKRTTTKLASIRKTHCQDSGNFIMLVLLLGHKTLTISLKAQFLQSSALQPKYLYFVYIIILFF